MDWTPSLRLRLFKDNFLEFTEKYSVLNDLRFFWLSEKD